jgi:hypothetical protein
MEDFQRKLMEYRKSGAGYNKDYTGCPFGALLFTRGAFTFKFCSMTAKQYKERIEDQRTGGLPETDGSDIERRKAQAECVGGEGPSAEELQDVPPEQRERNDMRATRERHRRKSVIKMVDDLASVDPSTQHALEDLFLKTQEPGYSALRSRPPLDASASSHSWQGAQAAWGHHNRGGQVYPWWNSVLLTAAVRPLTETNRMTSKLLL